MQILCELKRFKEKITRGKFAGGITEYSIAVGGDNYSWNIVKVTYGKTTPPLGQKYFKGFCDLLNYLRDFNIDPHESIPKIIDALEENTGINSDELREKVKELPSLKTKGIAIDQYFKCNYNRVDHDTGKLADPNRIYVRVLKADIKTTAEKEQ